MRNKLTALIKSESKWLTIEGFNFYPTTPKRKVIPETLKLAFDIFEISEKKPRIKKANKTKMIKDLNNIKYKREKSVTKTTNKTTTNKEKERLLKLIANIGEIPELTLSKYENANDLGVYNI